MSMTIFRSDTDLLQALGWSLLHFLWQGAMIALALSAFLRIARGHSSQFRHVASCIALGLMLLCPAGTFFYIALKPGPALRQASAHAVTLSIRETSLPSSSFFANLTAAANREMPWIVAAWCTGVLVFFLHLLIGGIAAEWLKKKSLMSVPDAVRSLAGRVAEQLKISQSFQLFASSAVAGPMVVGWLRPIILVPLASFSGLPSEQMEAVLAHELAHIRRQDYLMNTLQTIAEALLFYHPAAWWVSKQIRREREHCCDDVAVMMSGSAQIYAEALSLLEEQRGSSTTPQLALGANGGQLAMRIKRLLTHREHTAASRGATLSLLSLGIVTVGTVFLFSGVVVSKVGAQSLQPTSQSSSAVLNALKERRPDMTCTYYDPRGFGYSGTCEARAGQQESYDCRAASGKELTQDQIACGWKVQRLRKWELRQRREK